jgi:hypothetical protein
MSIYATLWCVKFPKDGFTPIDDEWIEVIAQAVPAHIGSPTPGEGYEDGDPFADFLPPPVETDGRGNAPFMRAVVIVAGHRDKGTPRSGQEYHDPLMVLTGEQYASATFEELLLRITRRIHERHQLESLKAQAAHGKRPDFNRFLNAVPAHPPLAGDSNP